MKITGIETVRIEENANLLWVRVMTDEGITGLGETFFMARTVETYVHDQIAPRVIGENPLDIERLGRLVRPYVGYRSTGVETRGNSAFDVALWDLFGKVTNQPVAQLLGGFARREIATYNTCAGTAYMRNAKGQTTANYDIVGGKRGQYDDLNAFLTDAGELAEDLLSEGITGMKIWPFDLAAERTDGRHIPVTELKAALVPFEKIRQAVGDRMDIMVEFHSMWQLLPAIELARALEPFNTYWHEDPIRIDCLSDLKRYAAASRAPVCASESLAGRSGFRDLLETGAAGILNLDLTWCGGLTEANKIAAMADTWQLPVAPHDCTGPVTLAASTHLSLSAPNALIQESVRAFYRTWYRDLVTELPPIANGMITIPPGPGLGLELSPDIDKRFTTVRVVTDAASL
ncbi:MAG TPA: mandelate racemase/muconate lactonizing enzyme family protein [Devosiaceae bacterium]